jgi:hypothetical protein
LPFGYELKIIERNFLRNPLLYFTDPKGALDGRIQTFH